MTLTEFLLARIAEDEAAVEFNDWDPRRVLAECEARREVVDAIGRFSDQPQSVARYVVRILATVYADHPDYDPSWRPD